MVTTKQVRVVSVWHDETPEPNDRAWVVADEEIDSRGDAVITLTARAFGENRTAAVEFGRERAARLGVELRVQD